MKTKLPPEIAVALGTVERIADDLASTACHVENGNLAGMDLTGVIDNLDEVAAAVTLADLADAPAKLMAAARAFRQTFPSSSLGWQDAAELHKAACLIAARLAATA